MNYFLLVIAGLELVLFLWALRAFRGDRTNYPLLIITVMLSLQWVDALIFGIGSWVGEGNLLELLNRLRTLWFFVTSPLLLLASVLILKNARFAWLQSKTLVGVVALICLVYMVMDGYAVGQADFYPACAADTLRYVMKVAPDQVCAGDELLPVDGHFSLMLLVSTAAVILAGLVLAIWRSWPWLVIMSGVFILGFIFVPTEVVGPFLSFPLDGLMSATIVLTTIRFSPSFVRHDRA